MFEKIEMQNKEVFEMMYELQEINEIRDNGYANTYDISVEDEPSFHLSNGIISHNSAVGGLMPAFGRENYGYFELKGVPLNAYASSQKDFMSNKELSELHQVLVSEMGQTYDDGKWYEIEINGETVHVNQHDEITINGNLVNVADLIQ